MNNSIHEPEHQFPAVFVFLLLGVFALFSLVLVLFGAQAYHAIVDHTAEHGTQRVLNAYIRNIVRTEDCADTLRMETLKGETSVYSGDEEETISFDPVNALVVSDPADEGEYVKYIYVYNGSLMELYTETEYGFDPEAGEIICAADALSVEKADGFYRFTVTSGGRAYVTDVALRCGEVKL